MALAAKKLPVRKKGPSLLTPEERVAAQKAGVRLPGQGRPVKDPEKYLERKQREAERAAAELAEVMDDPAQFCEVFLGHRLWDKQAEILRGVRDNPAVAVKACHASSKSFTAAELVAWWMARHYALNEGAICITTAPTDNQVRTILWGEVHKAIQGSRMDGMPKANQTEWRWGPGLYAMGFTTLVDSRTGGTRFQGFHERNVLVIVDEAPGVDPQIFEALEGARAGGHCRVVLLGNPTHASGPFYEAFTSKRDRWKTYTIDALDTPNLRGLNLDDLRGMREDDPRLDENPMPFLVGRRWVREKLLDWGEQHPLWQARVRGQFPDQAPDSLISLAWLERAGRDADPSGDQVVAGLDVAGPGEDETVLKIRRGGAVLGEFAWESADPRGAVVAELRRWCPGLVNVDSIGIGYNMALHIQDQGFRVQQINVGASPAFRAGRPEDYHDLKAQLYWNLRQLFERNEVSGLRDERTIAQLAGIRYEHTPKGKLRIESKEDMRRRGAKSPDRAEALMLAFTPSLRQMNLAPIVSLERQSPWRIGAGVVAVA